jgi:hypothetical protein
MTESDVAGGSFRNTASWSTVSTPSKSNLHIGTPLRRGIGENPRVLDGGGKPV